MSRVKTDFIIFIAIALFLPLLHYLFEEQFSIEKTETPIVEIKSAAKYEYGIPVDSFIVEFGEIAKNQTLATLLGQFNVSARTVHNMAVSSKEIFDLRKMKIGQPFQAFFNRDSLRSLKYFVYEINPSEYVLYDIKDSVIVTRNKREITIVEKTATGEIKSSLWNAMADSELDPIVAIKLSDIFAWSIDFFGLQKGDYFKMIYEEHFVDSQSLGVKKIVSAVFNHYGKDFYAIPFNADSVERYYDENGNTLKKAFLKAPLIFSRISSGFSYHRMHPVLKYVRPHTGVDYSAPAGTPVSTIGDGVVIFAAYRGQGGNMVKIQHNSVYQSGYLHLSGFAEGIHTGAHVRQGQLIGYVGSTGLATGPHLDFRIWMHGQPVDPTRIQSPPGEPLKGEKLTNYNQIKQPFIKRLQNIKFKSKLPV